MFKDKLKKIVGNSEGQGNNKRKIENLVFLVIILIITVVIINYVWSGEKSSNKKVTNSTGKQLATANNNQTLASSQYNNTESISLEEKLEDILSKIEGVGSVKVFINYSESSETVAMYNENSKTSTTEETDKSGGTRKVEQTDSQKEVIYQEQNGTKAPIVQKTVEPKIEGAIITAKGAGDVNVKTSIIQAVEAATGLATHKIQVFTMSV
jgi:stage III sporulation protein AG